MVFLAALVFGYLSLGRLPVQLMPELTYPTITVRTEYPGAAPEEVENDIGRPIEEALGVVGGLNKISSINRAGISDVVLEFVWGTEMHDAAQDVLEKLDRVFLPTDAERPLILHYDPSLDPIMELSLSGQGERFEGEQGLRRLRRLAELQVKRELEPVTGVAAVRVRGGLEEQIHVLIEEEALRRTNVSIQDVINRVSQENINVAGGTLKEGRIEYLVRTLNEYEDLQQIEDTIVTRFEGRDVRVKDLGVVAWAQKEREILTRTDGGESVQIDIYKEADANIVAVADRIVAAMGEFDPDAKEEDAAAKGGISFGPPKPKGLLASSGMTERLYKDEGALLQVVADRSEFIESSINDVRDSAILGGILAIFVLYLFLRNVKSTVIVAVSIPMALLVTFAPMNLLGVSLNIMSLGGLALGIGMLVDSSIVVLESIYRCREEGDDTEQAANRGTQEVRSAVFASTLTSIAVFFPMVFVEGLAGQAFGDLGLAVVFSLLAAAAVALWFIPMVSARTGLGLGVVLLVLSALGLSQAGPMAAGAVAGLVVLMLAIGFLTILIMAATGRLEMDDYSRRSMGLWRWKFLQDFKGGLRTPLNGFKTSASGIWRVLRQAIVIPTSILWVPLAYVYLLLRFIVGSIGEWVIGKPILLGFLGAVVVVRRVVVPLVAFLFGLVAFIPTRIVGWVLDRINNVYPRIVRAAVAHPFVMVLLTVACLGLTWQVGSSLDSELLPEVYQGEFTVEVALPVGTPIEETESVIAPIEQAILTEKDNIRSLALTVGFDAENTQRSDEGEHTARFKVMLDEDSRGPEQEQAVIDRLRNKFVDVPDLEARVVRPVLFSSKTPIEVEVSGQDLDKVKLLGDQAAEAMAALPELADVESTLQAGAPEVQILYDRERLSRYGLNIGQVARLVRDKVKGNEATRFNLKDRRVPILVRLAMDDRETVEDVRATIVNPGGERPIPLSAVADVSLGEGPSEVRRIEGRRVALIRANLAEGSLSQAALAIDNALGRNVEWPADVTYFISGQNEEWERSERSLYLALALSMFLVYVIMAAQFESLTHPLVIMLTIPLAFVGTVLALKLLGLNLSIVVFLGMIMLAGIVVNNAIVLVDYINTLRKRDMSRDEAIVQAGSVRLRPILMTTATTVLGLLPLALGLGDAAEIRAPMAIAVISGLITSTLLTLIVIPSFYALMDSAVSALRPTRVKVGTPGALDALKGSGSEGVTP
ncbi:acriflavin resistance protein [Acidobacteria bacterium Mor1]|nr:acriflavin resistance protein [Acidobacteria bacterium Mor1]